MTPSPDTLTPAQTSHSRENERAYFNRVLAEWKQNQIGEYAVPEDVQISLDTTRTDLGGGAAAFRAERKILVASSFVRECQDMGQTGELLMKQVLGHELNHILHTKHRPEDEVLSYGFGAVVGLAGSFLASLLPIKDKMFAIAVGAIMGVGSYAFKRTHRSRQAEYAADLEGIERLIVGMDKEQAIQALTSIKQPIYDRYTQFETGFYGPFTDIAGRLGTLGSRPSVRAEQVQRVIDKLQTAQSTDAASLQQEMQPFFQGIYQEHERASGLQGLFAGK